MKSKFVMVLIGLVFLCLQGCGSDNENQGAGASSSNSSPNSSSNQQLGNPPEQPQAITIESISPRNSNIMGGGMLEIKGSGFTLDSIVTLGDVNCPIDKTSRTDKFLKRKIPSEIKLNVVDVAVSKLGEPATEKVLPLAFLYWETCEQKLLDRVHFDLLQKHANLQVLEDAVNVEETIFSFLTLKQTQFNKIAELYKKYLNRNATSTEANNILVANGTPNWNMRRHIILNSAEFYKTTGGNSDSKFIDKLYLLTQEKTLTLEEKKIALQKFKLVGKSDFVHELVYSSEHYRILVREWHKRFTGKYPTENFTTNLVNLLKQGTAEERVQTVTFGTSDYTRIDECALVL